MVYLAQATQKYPSRISIEQERGYVLWFGFHLGHCLEYIEWASSGIYRMGTIWNTSNGHHLKYFEWAQSGIYRLGIIWNIWNGHYLEYIDWAPSGIYRLGTIWNVSIGHHLE